MEQAIEKYISESKTININLGSRLYPDLEIDTNKMSLSCSENDNVLQKVILSKKYISVEVDWKLDSYKNINIFSCANEIIVEVNITSENMIDIIYHSINLQRLILTSEHISEIGIKNKLNEKKFLKYIKIKLKKNVNLDDIYEILKIKSLDTLYFYGSFFDTYLNSEQILKILCYIVNNLNKKIKIVFDCYGLGKTFKKYISLITYNFKIHKNNYSFTFTYITKKFKNFDNLYDFNLCYQ